MEENEKNISNTHAAAIAKEKAKNKDSWKSEKEKEKDKDKDLESKGPRSAPPFGGGPSRTPTPVPILDGNQKLIMSKQNGIGANLNNIDPES